MATSVVKQAPDRFRLGADVGGTFTDVVLSRSDGAATLLKVLSSTRGYERATVEGITAVLRSDGVAPNAVKEVLHGTTAATNAVLERRGAVTGLLTSRGFSDVLELRRLRMPDIYNVFWEKPDPLVPRNLRREVEERVGGDGEVITPLDITDARQQIIWLLRQGITSLAVSLIHSYRFSEHERLIGDLVRKEFPHLFLSLSSEVLPELGEYERTSTTVTNAYVMPVMARYLEGLRASLDGIDVRAPLLIMQSSGGLMTSGVAQRQPVFGLESGPAAGVIAASTLAGELGLRNVVTFDMGGTTAKASLVEDGEPYHAAEYEIGAPVSTTSRLLKGGGYLVRVRAIDIAEVGAGGGSIVSVDLGGSLQVGPRSTGARPGPACYGLGGAEATVTDANMVLGYLNQDSLGGHFDVYPEKAHAALAPIADRLGLPLVEAAYAVHIVSNATMARVIRAVTTEQGRDVRDFTLLAFGGNGPVHAVELARSLGVHRVVVPPAPGLFSALGLLAAPLEQTAMRALMRPAESFTSGELRRAYRVLEQRVADILRQENIDVGEVEFVRLADLRYAEQVHELTIPVPDKALQDGTQALEGAFGEEHERRYGHRSADERITVSTIRVVARHRLSDRGAAWRIVPRRGPPARSPRPAYFGREHGVMDALVLRRADLGAVAHAGPLIVDEYDTTIVVPPRTSTRADEHGNVLIEL
jgi:N-methylhydantoinase A